MIQEPYSINKQRKVSRFPHFNKSQVLAAVDNGDGMTIISVAKSSNAYAMDLSLYGKEKRETLAKPSSGVVTFE